MSLSFCVWFRFRVVLCVRYRFSLQVSVGRRGRERPPGGPGGPGDPPIYNCHPPSPLAPDQLNKSKEPSTGPPGKFADPGSQRFAFFEISLYETSKVSFQFRLPQSWGDGNFTQLGGWPKGGQRAAKGQPKALSYRPKRRTISRPIVCRVRQRRLLRALCGVARVLCARRPGTETTPATFGTPRETALSYLCPTAG